MRPKPQRKPLHSNPALRITILRSFRENFTKARVRKIALQQGVSESEVLELLKKHGIFFK